MLQALFYMLEIKKWTKAAKSLLSRILHLFKKSLTNWLLCARYFLRHLHVKNKTEQNKQKNKTTKFLS